MRFIDMLTSTTKTIALTIFSGFLLNFNIAFADPISKLKSLPFSDLIMQPSKVSPASSNRRSRFGYSVAMSSETDTIIYAVVGEPSFIGGNNKGAAWIYKLDKRVQPLQWVAKQLILPEDASTGAGFGSSVSMASNGTAIIGAPGDNEYTGAAWIYAPVKTGSTISWKKITKLVARDAKDIYGNPGKAAQGVAVSISNDASTAFVGGTADFGGQGAVWAYQFASGKWSQQGNKITINDVFSNHAAFGASIATTNNGGMLVVGSPGDNTLTGAARVFVKSGSSWIQKGNKLVGSDAIGRYNRQGATVSIIPNTTSFLVGAPGDNDGRGAVWIYQRGTNNVWNQLGPKITSGSVAKEGFGAALASNNYGKAVIGAPYATNNRGIVYSYARNAITGRYDKYGSGFVGSGATERSYQGTSLAMTSQNYLLVGAPFDYMEQGAIWFFKYQTNKWAPLGQKIIDKQ